MGETTAEKQQYIVSIHESKENDGTFIVNVEQTGLARAPNGTPKRSPQFMVAVRHNERGLAFDWSGTLDDPSAAREDIEADIAARMKDREIWIDRVTSLVSQVEQWSTEMGWSTRRVEKKLDDARIGKHRVPALLMQETTCRILLEPVGRSTTGAEGVVDLYLLPAYDDIAGLYFYQDRWNVHYLFPGANSVATIHDADAVPLSKETFEKVLAEMRQYAA